MLILNLTRTNTWNLPGPSGLVNPSTPPPSSVVANTDVIHNQRQEKTLKVAAMLLFRQILNTKSWLECCFNLLIRECDRVKWGWLAYTTPTVRDIIY